MKVNGSFILRVLMSRCLKNCIIPINLNKVLNLSIVGVSGSHLPDIRANIDRKTSRVVLGSDFKESV